MIRVATLKQLSDIQTDSLQDRRSYLLNHRRHIDLLHWRGIAHTLGGWLAVVDLDCSLKDIEDELAMRLFTGGWDDAGI